MSRRLFENDLAARQEIVRAGATHPNAVPSSYFQPSWTSASPALKRSEIASTSKTRHTRPRPAFGATRHEGAIGPIQALSHYADVVDYNQRHAKKRTDLKAHCRNSLQAPVEEFQIVAKGPTAETIISMTAAGRKPPVPEAGQIERHKKTLSKISAYMEIAVSGRVNDNDLKEQSVKSINELELRTNTGSRDRIPGDRQTWGAVASSPQEFAPLVFAQGPGGARYPQNYPPGIIRSQ